MRPRPFAHRLLALVMGVLALQLTLRGGSPACSVPTGAEHAALVAPTAGGPELAGHASMAVMAHGHAESGGVVAQLPMGRQQRATPTETSASDAPAPVPVHCPMLPMSGGCVTQACAAASLTLGTVMPGLMAANVAGEPGWAATLSGLTRSILPDVPPPKV